MQIAVRAGNRCDYTVLNVICYRACETLRCASFQFRASFPKSERTHLSRYKEPAPLGLRGVVGHEDYVADFDAVAAAIAERSVREEAERPRHAKELEVLQWQQAVAANEKAEEWRRIRAEQTAKYVDMCSSGEED
ncbi:CDPK-related protein kinase [Hordeum vulgare]|nr:CDPK-related protein kinase [Hordeum vulgare]